MYCSDTIRGALLLALGLFVCGSRAADNSTLTLAWDPNPEPDIAGYRLYYGPSTGPFTGTNNLGLTPRTTLYGLTPGVRYRFAVSAFTTSGVEGDLSSELIFDPTTLPAGPEQAFITAQQSGSWRSDFTGWVGMKFTAGDRPIVVNALGRWSLPGNTRPHRMKLARASSGEEVTGSLISVPPGPPGQFAYARLPTPIVLAANTSYYLVSEESLNGDAWLDLDTRVEPASAAFVHGPVYSGGGLPWVDVARPNYSYGTVDMKFALQPTPPTSTNDSPAAGASPYVLSHSSGSLRNDFTGWVGLKMTVGPNPISITELGRLSCVGNAREHQVKVVRVRDQQDLAAVSVNLAGATPGQFRYAPLPQPLLLETNQSYYLVSQELFAGDHWLDFGGTVLTTATVATTDAAVFFGNGFSWTLAGGPDQSFGAVNLKFERSSDPTLGGRLVNGQFELVLDQTAGSRYVIETSTDLINWVPVASTMPDLPSLPQPQAPNSGQRYYRLVLLP